MPYFFCFEEFLANKILIIEKLHVYTFFFASNYIYYMPFSFIEHTLTSVYMNVNFSIYVNVDFSLSYYFTVYAQLE